MKYTYIKFLFRNYRWLIAGLIGIAIAITLVEDTAHWRHVGYWIFGSVFVLLIGWSYASWRGWWR